MKHLYTKFLLCSFTLSGGALSAQNGPGGVGTSANNKLWLDANRGVSLTGASVTSWADQSGSANNAAPAVAAARPVLTGNTVNGYPSITFDGLDDELRVTDNASLDLTSWQFYYVSRATVQKNYNAHFVKGNDSQENYEMLSYSDGNLHTPTYYTDGTRTFPSTAAGQLTTAGFNIFEYSYSAAVGRDVYKNNTSIHTDNENKTPAANNFDLYIGNERTTSRYLNGDIAELIIFNAPLNSTQRIIVNNYLAAKYNLALGANDVYTMDNAGNGNYDHDVAGIGRIAAGNLHSDSRGSGIVRISNPSGLGNNEFFMWGHDNGTLGSWGVADLPAGVQARLERVWRVSESGGDVGTVDIGFDLGGLGPVTATDLRLLIDTDGDGVFSDETAGGGGVVSGAALSGGLYVFSGINLSDTRRFTVGSINWSQTPLPVELLDFDAIYAENNVQISWSTATEVNNDYFIIERSKNGTDFEEVQRVKGAGSSTGIIDYYELDRAPLEGVSYYRLKQVDFNGKYTFSNVVPVNIYFDRKKGVFVYPNPGTIEDLKIVLNGFEDQEVLVVLRDVKGNEVVSKLQLVVEDGAIIGIDPQRSIAPGTYLITASSKNELFSQKVVIR